MVRVSFTQNVDFDISITGVEARYKASNSGGCNSNAKVLLRWAESSSWYLVTTNSGYGYGVDDVDITCCDLCPAGYYCSTPSATPVICAADTYCPEESTAETNCPGGNDVTTVQGLKCANECNLCLSIFSFYGVTRTMPQLLHYIVTRDFKDVVCTEPTLSYGHGACGLATQLFILSKIPELGDTLFLALKGVKLDLLQWYHHHHSTLLRVYILSSTAVSPV